MTVKVAGPQKWAGALHVRSALQDMRPKSDQLLVIAWLACEHAEAVIITTAEVGQMYLALRIPAPANISRDLGKLRDAGLLVQSRGGWAFTPNGELRAQSVAPSTRASEYGGPVVSTSRVRLGELPHAVLPPALAPASHGAAAGVARLVQDGSFDTNVMMITRFPEAPDDTHAKAIKAVRAACAQHGLQLRVASDAQVEATLWSNVVSYMWACKYAVVIVDETGTGLNPNVLIEVGGMLMAGRQCVILRDASTADMPTDLVGHIYKPVDLADASNVASAVHEWAAADLGFGKCIAC